MPRAKAIAYLILGSQSIVFTPISIPSNHPPESPNRILRDIIRSLLWVFTGSTISREFFTLNMLFLKLFTMRLDQYTPGTYTPGAAYWKQVLWYFVGSPLVASDWIPISAFKVWLLRCFGGQIGKNVNIKPGVRIKFPWRLTVGDCVWIGEDAWIDNVATVTIDNHVCISQGAYLCTGNHDWNNPNFQLITASIHIQESSWIAAKCVVGPGVVIGRGAVLALGGVAAKSLEPMTIYAGNPAQAIKQRHL